MRVEPVQDAERAFQRVVRMLNASEQSSAKVREKLARAGYDDMIVEEALTRAVNCNILDDSRYAEMLVRSTISQGKGFRFIRSELEGIGISLEEVGAYREYEEAVSAGSSTDEERACAFLDAHPPRAKNLRDAAFRKLMGKGYDMDTAANVARRWSDAQR